MTDSLASMIPAAGSTYRISSLSLFSHEPEGRVLRWSEIQPAVRTSQIFVAVVVDGPGGQTEGVAGRTVYADSSEPASLVGATFDASLAAWLGVDPLGLGSSVPARAVSYFLAPEVDPVRPLVELAILDALGRRVGLPAACFLGGLARRAVPAYASLPSFADADSALACASSALEAGFGAVKFHGSGIVSTDLETISRLPDEIGDLRVAMWDGNCGYDLTSASLIADALSRAGFLWFEAPLEDDDTSALRWLAARTRIPLIPDGLRHRVVSDIADEVMQGIWGGLRVDVTSSHSVGHATRVIRLAEAMGLNCEIQSFGYPAAQHANLQFVLATGACRYFEIPFPTEDFEDGLSQSPALHAGGVCVPEVAGLGHGISLNALRTHCAELSRFGLEAAG